MSLPSSGYALATVSNPSSALTDFTLIINLALMPSLWWITVDTTDGSKGRAAKTDETELACDWIDFDSTNHTGLLRVKWVGTLAGSGIQQIRVYPPLAVNVSYGATDTYGCYAVYDSGWRLYTVHHLISERKTGAAPTAINSPSPAAGLIGNATDFAINNSQRLRYDTAVGTGGGDFSGFIMANAETLSATRGLFGTDFRSWIASTGVSVRINSTICEGVLSLSTGVWHVYSFTYNYTTGALVLYVDGAQILSTTAEASYSDTNQLEIGSAYAYSSTLFDGQLQHCQLHETTRSAAWHAHEASQLLDNSTFWGTWNWQVCAGITSNLSLQSAKGQLLTYSTNTNQKTALQAVAVNKLDPSQNLSHLMNLISLNTVLLNYSMDVSQSIKQERAVALLLSWSDDNETITQIALQQTVVELLHILQPNLKSIIKPFVTICSLPQTQFVSCVLPEPISITCQESV